jgi:hypothetical protein
MVFGPLPLRLLLGVSRKAKIKVRAISRVQIFLVRHLNWPRLDSSYLASSLTGLDNSGILGI